MLRKNAEEGGIVDQKFAAGLPDGNQEADWFIVGIPPIDSAGSKTIA